MTNSKMVTLEAEQVDFIKALPGEFNFSPKKDDGEGNQVPNTESPLYGKKYRRFAYGDAVFIANTEDEFCKLYDDEQLWKVMLTVNDAGQYSLVKGVSIKRTIATATTSATIKKIYRDVETTEINDDVMSQLING